MARSCNHVISAVYKIEYIITKSWWQNAELHPQRLHARRICLVKKKSIVKELAILLPVKNWKQLLPIKERTAIRNKLRAKALNEFGLRLEQHWHKSENKSSKFIQRVEFTKEEAACFKSVEYCGITSKKRFHSSWYKSSLK